MRTKGLSKNPIVRQMQKHAGRSKEEEVPHPVQMLSTGSTLLNLAISDRWNGGYGLGKVVNIIGDTQAGKTTLALTAFAEATHRKRFNDYLLRYDEPEAALEHDIGKLFGEATKARARPPKGTLEEPEPSETIEQFQYNLHGIIKKNKPFIYILDALDALDSEDDEKKMAEKVKAYENGTEAKGSYGMSKAKTMSSMLRQVIRKIKQTDSLLIVISQTRDNINPMSFTPKTRSGGRALEFYASHIMWLGMVKKIKKNGEVIGVICRVKSSKSKLTGKSRTVEFPIYYEYGIDDVGSCVDYLVRNKVNISRELGLLEGNKPSRIIKEVEAKGLEKELAKLTGRVWKTNEDKLLLNRKSKYE